MLWSKMHIYVYFDVIINFALENFEFILCCTFLQLSFYSLEL